MTTSPSPRRHVRTRTRPAAVSNVVQFPPRAARAAPEPSRPGSRTTRLADIARRCGLVFAPDGSGTLLSPITGTILFEQPACLDSADGTLLLELFLGLYERGLLANRLGDRGESQ